MSQDPLPLDGGRVYGRYKDYEEAQVHIATMLTAIEMRCPVMAGVYARLAAHHINLWRGEHRNQEAA